MQKTEIYITPSLESNDFIYLISDDGHRDFIDLNVFCMTDDDIKNYITNYQKEMFGLNVRNIIIDYNNNKINFETNDIYSPDDWEVGKMFLHKIKKFNV
jgi:hypothetical protein